MAVAGYHVYLLFLQKFNVATFEDVAQFGYLGVPYFFVLSGFIIAFAHWKDLGKLESLPNYGYRRIVRLYPIYIIFSVLFVIAAQFGLGDAEISYSPANVIENVTLVRFTPDFATPPLKVAWTLFYEVRFYLLFALIIVSPRVGALAGILWGISCFLISPINPLTEELLSFWNFAFFLGIASAVSYRILDSKFWPIFIFAGIILCATIFTGGALDLKDKRSWLILPISGGFASIVLGLALAEKGGWAVKQGIGTLIGDASYSIYLVHSAVISVAVVVIAKLGLQNTLPHWLMFFPVLAGSILAGVLAHLLVEKPILKALRKWQPRRKDKTPDYAASDAALP